MYSELFDDCFKAIETQKIHSVSFGPLRFPKAMYRKMRLDRPKDKIFASNLELKNGIFAYKKNLEIKE